MFLFGFVSLFIAKAFSFFNKYFLSSLDQFFLLQVKFAHNYLLLCKLFIAILYYEIVFHLWSMWTLLVLALSLWSDLWNI